MKRSKLLLLLLPALLAMACSDSFAPVTVPHTPRSVADFTAFKDLFFIDFVCSVPDLDLDAGAEVRRIFIEEIPFATGKDVVRLEPEHWAGILDVLQRYRLDVDIRYEDSVFFQRIFQANPRALFFTGKLKLDIKTMGVIKEVRDELGNKKNAYETVEMWEMELQVALIDGDRSRILWQDKYAEKGEPVPGATTRFRFNSMLAKLAAKLITALQPRKVLQERFILSK